MAEPAQDDKGSTRRATPPDRTEPADDFGANEWLVEEMYEQYQADPRSVDPAWVAFFRAQQGASGSGTNGAGAAASSAGSSAASNAASSARCCSSRCS